MSDDLNSLKKMNAKLTEDNTRLAVLASEYESKVKQLSSGSKTVTTSLNDNVSKLKTDLSTCKEQNRSLQGKIDDSVLIQPTWANENSATQSPNGIIVIKVAGNGNLVWPP